MSRFSTPSRTSSRPSPVWGLVRSPRDDTGLVSTSEAQVLFLCH